MDGDLHAVSQASVSRIIADVSSALSRRAHHYIKFPTTNDDLRQVMRDFHAIAGFPNVIGCIDGTQIPIYTPKSNEHLYVCRKGFHSINVQGVCDSKLSFTNIVAKYPGSSHDSFILRNSSLYNYLEEASTGPNGGTGWLLGDSGYPLKEFLLTPVANPATGGEFKYNKSHVKTRNTIERAFGVLKLRFRCLHKTGGCLLSPPERCTKIITSCAVLHNICISNNIPVPSTDDDDDDTDDNITFVDNTPNIRANNIRSKLIAQRFQ